MATQSPAPAPTTFGGGSGGGNGGNDRAPTNNPTQQPDTLSADAALAFLIELSKDSQVKIDGPKLKKIQQCILTVYTAGQTRDLPPQFRTKETISLLNEDIFDTITLRDNNKTYNFSAKSNVNYLPALLGQISRNRVINGKDVACERCKKGNGPFVGCMSSKDKGFFKNACMNCGFYNHFGKCTFSSHTVVHRPVSKKGGPSKRAKKAASGSGGSSLKIPFEDGIDQNTPEGAQAIANHLTMVAAQYVERAEQGQGFSPGSQYSESYGSDEDGDDNSEGSGHGDAGEGAGKSAGKGKGASKGASKGAGKGASKK